MLHSAVVLACCLQAQSAEDLYQRFEKTLEEAKSIRVRIRTEMTSTDPDKSVAADLSVRCKPGDKYKIAIDPKRGDVAATTLVADGRQCWRRKSKTEEWREGPASKGMSRALIRGFARWSLLRFLILSHGERAEAADSLDVREFGEVTGGRIGERDVVEFAYTLAVRRKDGDDKYRVRLWLEEGTLLPVRRTLFAANDRGATIVTEHYDDFSTDEVPDAEFQKPKEENGLVSVVFDAWDEDLRIDAEAMTLVHTRTEYKYDRPEADTPSGSTVHTLLEGKVTREQVEALEKFVRECGFLDLKEGYGAPEDHRYYPYRLTVVFRGGKKKTVEFRSNPDFEKRPEAFDKLEKHLYELSKAVRNKK